MAKQITHFIDLNNCTGCNSCTVSCKAENNTPRGTNYQEVLTITSGKYPNPKKTFVPRPCMHCGKPACKAACPVGAISKREKDGIVLIDKEKCIGCKYCAAACPFGAPKFNEGAKVMEKCTMCVQRIDAGLEPACVTTCPAFTRDFGFVDEINSTGEGNMKRGFKLTGRTKAKLASYTEPSAIYLMPKEVK